MVIVLSPASNNHHPPWQLPSLGGNSSSNFQPSTRRIYVGGWYIWYISQKFIGHPGPPPSSTWTGSTSLLGTWSERRRPEMWASEHIYISMWAWVRPCCVTFNGSCVFIKYSPKGSSHNPKESMNQALLLLSSRIGFILSCFAEFSQHHAPKNLNKTSQISLKYVCMTYLLQM